MIPFYEPLSPNPPLLRWNLYTQEGIEEMKNNLQVYTTQEGMQEIMNNPQVYTTHEGRLEIKNNPQVYTTQQGAKNWITLISIRRPLFVWTLSFDWKLRYLPLTYIIIILN